MDLYENLENLCSSNLLMDLNIGFLVFASPLNLPRNFIVGFQKCQNYHQSDYHVLHYLCDLFLHKLSIQKLLI